MSNPSDPFNEYEFCSFRAFSAEQHRQLAIECGIIDSDAHGKLIDTMAQVSEMFPLQRGFEETFGSFKINKDRLEKIAAAATFLRCALAEEPLATNLLSGLSSADKLADQSRESKQLLANLLTTVEHLAASANTLALDPKELRTLRMEPKDIYKSVERREIWEPIFTLWRGLGKELGFTEGGPIMRVLQIMHVALELEPPNPYSVRQAIRDFKGGGVLTVVK